MKTLIIYDSLFGNTEKIARSVRDALGNGAVLVHMKDFQMNLLDDAGLIIAGSPTRAFRPTPALTNLLKRIPAGALKGKNAAAFDTRINYDEIKIPVLKSFMKWMGHAARHLAATLKKKGAVLKAPPEGFFVTGPEGPLKPGETERAGKWAKQLAL